MPNRLVHETSPYLRQHAHNPVDWYPWGEEAFARARAEDKPILLSIGYSACHWCHVMERESFEDEVTARDMNALFVNIKVDREERPDVDHIYMNAVQLLTGHGGWPMTMFLTPDGKPFYGGTYFPPEDRHGMPAFRRVLHGVAQAYREKRDEVEDHTGKLLLDLRRVDALVPGAAPPEARLVAAAAEALSRAYDEVNGGIGQAPKFPNATVLELFLRAHGTTGERRYLDLVTHTLRQMARGGIYDQLGGGFHRYSVDARWLVPHFEKMLYDNAQLVPLYLAAYQLTGEAPFAAVARETLDYLLREMRDPGGGFYATQDADSEGEEGRYFVWEAAEVRRLFDEGTAALVERYWDITPSGNFEDRNIVHVTLEVEQLARLFKRDVEEVRRTLASARATLLAAREQRVKPGRDEKILTAWNALAIGAFARAAEALDDDRYRNAALDAVSFLTATLQQGNRLCCTCKDGVARLNGYLDDYAFFAAALLDVFELTQDPAHLDHAVQLADAMLAHFWDADAGGFFFTSDDHEALIVRSKPAFDSALPSGNSVAARALLRLYHHTGHAPYLTHAEAVIKLFAGAVREQPFGLANMLGAIDFYSRQPCEIVVVVPGTGDHDLLRRIRQTYVPNRTLRVVDTSRNEPLPALLEGKGLVGGLETVYVCRGRTCSPPATSWEAVAPLLRS
ncbi:thioredoxin domain-containing protein [Candidatus Binatia bacterium]|nr:thioredoxin domain-containing protein [Candidatus Binatia bacterium]